MRVAKDPTRVIVLQALAENKKTQSEAAYLMGIRRETLNRRLNNPSHFELGELRSIEKYLSDKEIVEIVRGRT